MSLAILLIPLLSTFITADRPVIRMDEIQIEGSVRRPPISEIEASRLNQKVEEFALQSLIKLEKSLLKPMRVEDFRLLESMTR